jgi:hypothetical protein
MGRVYAINPDLSKGERYGGNCRAFSHPTMQAFYDGCFRVEFDEDTDEGMATIHGWLKCAVIYDKEPIYVADVLSKNPHKYTVRGYCRIRPKDSPSLDPNYAVDAEGNVWPIVKPVNADITI